MAQQRLIVEVVSKSGGFSRDMKANSHAVKTFEKDTSKATRGALAGSGAFKAMGRSLAFASGGFLAFAGVSQFLSKSVSAAQEAGVVEGQLAAQFRTTGRDAKDFQEQIDKTTESLSGLTGFVEDDLKAAFTTILRTQPNVGKALRDTASAADLARAKHISLAAAAVIVAKVEGGNTTLLRRQGIQVAKNATREEALATLRKAVAGQAAASATQQQKFNATLHTSEVIIGQALLPRLNSYLKSGTAWLKQMNDSGKLQKDVAHGARDIGEAFKFASELIHGVDSVTGSFKNTLELLIALKVARFAGRLTTDLVGVIGKFSGARTAALGFGTSLSGAQASIATQAGIASFALTTLILKATGADKALRRAGAALGADLARDANQKGSFTAPILRHLGLGDPTQRFNNGGIGATRNEGRGLISGVKVVDVRQAAENLLGAGKSVDSTVKSLRERFFQLSQGDVEVIVGMAKAMVGAFKSAGGAAEEAGVKAAHGLALAARAALITPPSGKDNTDPKGLNLTAGQRNTFFDNSIARILLRGGLGGIQKEIDALTKADTLIQRRIAKTKDVTRRQNLEDQLLQNQSNIAGLRAQQRSDAIQAAQDAADKRQAARNARQFRALGFTGTGEDVIPARKRLIGEENSLEKAVKGTPLDTKALRDRLARIKHVLAANPIIGRDVRSKIQETLAGIKKDLDNFTSNDLTRFRHQSSRNFVSAFEAATGISLNRDQARTLQRLVQQRSPSGKIPGTQSAAFAGAGASGKTTIYVTLDGKVVAKSVTKHQARAQRSRSLPRGI